MNKYSSIYHRLYFPFRCLKNGDEVRCPHVNEMIAGVNMKALVIRHQVRSSKLACIVFVVESESRRECECGQYNQQR